VAVCSYTCVCVWKTLLHLVAMTQPNILLDINAAVFFMLVLVTAAAGSNAQFGHVWCCKHAADDCSELQPWMGHPSPQHSSSAHACLALMCDLFCRTYAQHC
jgi:hypothetical protein